MNSEEKIMSEIAVLRAYLKRRLDRIEGASEIAVLRAYLKQRLDRIEGASEIAVLRAYLKQRLDRIESVLEGKPRDSSDFEATGNEDVDSAEK